MPIYRLTIEGRNFSGRMFDEPARRFGFFATRWVEACDKSSAERTATRALNAEFHPLLLQSRPEEPEPTLHLTEIEVLDEFPDNYPDAGATWFPMDD